MLYQWEFIGGIFKTIVFLSFFSVCRRFGATYCAEFDKNSRTDLQQAVTDCRRSCISQACEDAKLRVSLMLINYYTPIT